MTGLGTHGACVPCVLSCVFQHTTGCSNRAHLVHTMRISYESALFDSSTVMGPGYGPGPILNRTGLFHVESLASVPFGAVPSMGLFLKGAVPFRFKPPVFRSTWGVLA